MIYTFLLLLVDYLLAINYGTWDHLQKRWLQTFNFQFSTFISLSPFRFCPSLCFYPLSFFLYRFLSLSLSLFVDFFLYRFLSLSVFCLYRLLYFAFSLSLSLSLFSLFICLSVSFSNFLTLYILISLALYLSFSLHISLFLSFFLFLSLAIFLFCHLSLSLSLFTCEKRN